MKKLLKNLIFIGTTGIFSISNIHAQTAPITINEVFGVSMERFYENKGWIEKNREAQTYIHAGFATTVESELYKQTSSSFSFTDYTKSYDKAVRFSVPNENYSSGMADNISRPDLSLDFKITPRTIIYTLKTNQQGACGFKNSDDWVAAGDGAMRGGVPIRPFDPHKEYFGCKGGTHKAIGRMLAADGTLSLICPYTYTCTHYIRQVPRSSGRQRGRSVTASQGYQPLNIAPGQVYIGKAGEYGGDPYAPWQFTYKTTVTISLDEMAKANGISKQELALHIISASQINGIVLPTNPVNKKHELQDDFGCMTYYDKDTKQEKKEFVFYMSPNPIKSRDKSGDYIYNSPWGHLVACGLWEMLDIESYLTSLGNKYEQAAIQHESEEDYKGALECLVMSMRCSNNEEKTAKYHELYKKRYEQEENLAYRELKAKIDNNTANDSDLLDYIKTYNKDTQSEHYKEIQNTLIDQDAMAKARKFSFKTTSPEYIDSVRSIAISDLAKQYIDQQIARVQSERNAYVIKEISQFNLETPQEHIAYITSLPVDDETRMQVEQKIKQLGIDAETAKRKAEQTTFFKIGCGVGGMLFDQCKLGMDFHIGRCHHPINFHTGIYYNWVGTSIEVSQQADEEIQSSHINIKYQRYSIPIELRYNWLRTYSTSFYIGAGGILHYNKIGRLYEAKGSKQLTDGLNEHSVDGRVNLGMECQHIGMSVYYDFDITSPFNISSPVDNLQQYSKPNQKHLTSGNHIGLQVNFYL